MQWQDLSSSLPVPYNQMQYLLQLDLFKYRHVFSSDESWRIACHPYALLQRTL